MKTERPPFVIFFIKSYFFLNDGFPKNEINPCRIIKLLYDHRAVSIHPLLEFDKPQFLHRWCFWFTRMQFFPYCQQKLETWCKIRIWILPRKKFQYANPVKTQLGQNFIIEAEVCWFLARQRRRFSQFQVISVICFCSIFTVGLREKNMLGTKTENLF